MPRILINYGIQPYFRAVWNLDRAFIYNRQIWLGEIKHKFPFGRELSFGMNIGELEVIERLTSAGIQCLHVILVKPLWSKEVGSMYLLNNLQMRSRAALVACALSQESASRIFPVDAAVSGSHTSFSGTGHLKYRKARVTHFSLVGNMGEPTYTLAEALAKLMRGCALPAVTEECLRRYRAG
ncbi:hypothetical protein [Duganella sp. Leaf61]|uniref:hypothetical protein n=1 Tax=Duganella sp. Leaf61 TaxID=1736227 RepID=UPI0012E31A13|nr:hypothetical protein [Duganella sp. Leaf61]